MRGRVVYVIGGHDAPAVDPDAGQLFSICYYIPLFSQEML
jgi:hypothetical protein